jgi:predicted NAD/FAD-binding protein
MYDEVIFACHPDQALSILGQNVPDELVQVLSPFKYAVNTVYVHSDEALMPKSRAAWASWNYIGTSAADLQVRKHCD